MIEWGRFKPHDLVAVVWTDIQVESGWSDGTLEPAVIYSVGFLIGQTADHIRIAGAYASEGANDRPWSSTDAIPKGCISSIVKMPRPRILRRR